MTTEITLRTDMDVDLIRSQMDDLYVVEAARVSVKGADAAEATQGAAGLIDYLMKSRHGSPFEHNSATWRISAPIFVWREFMRHRIGTSYNEESGRYKQLDPVFYVPAGDRALIQVGKPGAYTFDITLESSSYTIECTLTEKVGESECGEPNKVSGDVDFDLSFDVSQLDPDEWNPDGPAGGFHLHAAEHTDDGTESSTRGPTEVQIDVFHDGAPLLSESYEITYERNDAFRGDERCGFCDELETREASFTQ